MSKKQTAVQWLIENFHSAKDAFGQAKEIEKEQIINAYKEGMDYTTDEHIKEAEQYYNETYGND